MGSNVSLLNLQRLHHFAWKCCDIEETKAFYTGILGLPLTHVIESDYVPSTGEYAPYTHIFFTMLDGSSIAFFDLGDGKAAKTTEDPWVIHFAFKVENEEELLVMVIVLVVLVSPMFLLLIVITPYGLSNHTGGVSTIFFLLTIFFTPIEEKAFCAIYVAKTLLVNFFSY